MPWISQATYTEGQEIVIEVVITANHAGHFDVFVCPDGDTSTQECFLDHPLTFVEDMLHGGPVDDHYPSRAYISPNAKFFKLKYRLPEGIQGDQAMLQWRYVTANSCTPPGYVSCGEMKILFCGLMLTESIHSFHTSLKMLGQRGIRTWNKRLATI
jgi:hypothetical protein